LIALVACCAAIFWAWRVTWDQNHPLQAAARGLGSGDPSRRAEAVRVVSDLGFGRAGESIRLLIPKLKDEDAGVRTAAAASMGLLGSNAISLGGDADEVRAASEALLGLTGDGDARVRTAVTRSLTELVSAAVAPRPGPRNAGPDGKASASPVDVDAVSTALTAALESPDEPVRQAALLGLGVLAARRSGGPPPALIKCLDDTSAVNRSAAADALSGYRQGLDPAIPHLLRRLVDEQRLVREACASAFRRIRPPAVGLAVAPQVIAALRTPDHAGRASLVMLLGRLKPDPRAAVPALIAVLREPIDSDSRILEQSAIAYDSYTGPAHEAARALGAIAPGTPQAGEAMAALIEVVRSGPSQRKGDAAEALGAFGPSAVSAAPVLIDLLNRTATAQVATRAGGSAAGALGKIAPGTPAAAEALAALTVAARAPWIPTRAAALAALPAFGPGAAAAIPAIRELKEKDPDPGVRQAAGTALAKIKP
jgi:HEAT repeat protein